MGHHIIMGRKTFESIDGPLPGRSMIVLSRNPEYVSDECLVVPNLEQALSIAKNRGESEIFIIGGGELFREAIKIAQRIYLTLVHTRVEADVFFPGIDFSKWDVIDKQEFDAGNKDQYPYTFMILERGRLQQA